MELCMEKITANTNKGFFAEIVSIGQKLKKNYVLLAKTAKQKNFKLSRKINWKHDGRRCEFNRKVTFIELVKKDVKKFLIFEQLMKKFGAEFFHLEETEFKMVVCFESEKTDSYFKKIEEMKILSAKILTLEKSFL